MQNFILNRIQKLSSLDKITSVCRKVVPYFDLGEYISSELIEVGYEDINVRIDTSKGIFLTKFFGDFRDADNRKRYVDIVVNAIKHGVAHPKLIAHNDIYLNEIDGCYMMVMEYIQGKSYYEFGTWPTEEQAIDIIKQASLINSLNTEPQDYYDEWSPVNLLTEYEKKSYLLSTEEINLIQPILVPFSNIDFAQLRYALVHGDIIRPNVLLDGEKQYIIDFSVASLKPIQQELAVLICGLFYNPDYPESVEQAYDLIIKHYAPKLNAQEISELKLFVKACFAMYLMLGIYTKVVLEIYSVENQYWIDIGRSGLQTDFVQNS